MQMIVQQTSSTVASDPFPTCEMDRRYSFHRYSRKKTVRIKVEVQRVSVQVVQIEKQIAFRVANDRGEPRCFITITARRIDQRGNVFHVGRKAHDLFCAAEIVESSLDRRFSPWRRRKVTDFNPTTTHKREMFRPELRLHFLTKPRHVVQTSCFNRNRGC